MLRFIIWGLFCVGTCNFSMAQDCYRLFYDKGIQAYDTLDFETAINQFEAARICDDLPRDNDVDEWINKAQNGYINAIKAEQTKSQSLALTAKSIIELLKKENATKAFRYAQLALDKDETPEARSALYESFYQLEEGTRKNFYVRDILAFTNLNNSIRNAGFMDGGQIIFVFGELDNIVRLFNFDGEIIGELESSVHWFDEQAHCQQTGVLLTTQKIDGRHYLIGKQLLDGKLAEGDVFSYPSPSGDVKAAAISKDGQFIVVSFYDGSTHVLDAKGKLLYKLPEEKNGATQINFSEGNTVALSYSRLVKVMQLGNEDYQISLDTLEVGMYNAMVRLSPKGTYLMAGYGRRFVVWNVNDGTRLYPTKSLSFQMGIGMFSSDEKYMAYGQGFFNLEDSTKVNDFSSEVRHLVFSPDLKYLVANIGSNKARIWRDQNYEAKAHGVLGGHKDYIRHIVFSPDSTHVLTASVDNTIKIWNVRMLAAKKRFGAGNLLGTFVRGDTTYIGLTYKDELYFLTEDAQFSHAHYFSTQNILTIDPRGKYIFNNVENGFEIYTLDLQNKQLDYISGIRHRDTANMARFLSDDLLVFYSNANLTFSLEVWNFQEGGLRYLSGYDTELMALSCAADQKHVAALDVRGKAYLWRVSKEGAPELLRSWIPHPDYGSTDITFSRDSKHIITTGYDNLANVWTLEGDLVARLIDHLDKVISADTSPDGEFIVTASFDKTAKIWTKAGELIATLVGYDGSTIKSARFSEDGSYIITNFLDGTLMIWPFKPSIIVNEIEKYQIPELSPSERAKYK